MSYTTIESDIIDARDFPEIVKDLLEECDTFGELPEDHPKLQAVVELADEICYGETSDGDPVKAGAMLERLGEKYGVVFVADDYFEEYARDLASDLGCIENPDDWPACFIDWGRAADSLLNDYSTVSIGVKTYHCSNY